MEATEILENGGIIPGASVGASPELIQMADKVRASILLFHILTTATRGEAILAG